MDGTEYAKRKAANTVRLSKTVVGGVTNYFEAQDIFDPMTGVKTIQPSALVSMNEIDAQIAICNDRITAATQEKADWQAYKDALLALP